MELLLRASMLMKTRNRKEVNCLLKCVPQNIREEKGICKLSMEKIMGKRQSFQSSNVKI